MGNVVRSRILCLGIDGAGKTAFIDKVQHPDQDIPTSPTDAYVVRDVKVKGVVLNVWDVAGRSSTRSLWKHYFAEGSTDAVIWVVDSSSSEDKLEESKQALASVLMDPNLAGAWRSWLFRCLDFMSLSVTASFARIICLADTMATSSYDKCSHRLFERFKIDLAFNNASWVVFTDLMPGLRQPAFLAIPMLPFAMMPFLRACSCGSTEFPL
jgi:GTPase SAR1 family protein